MKSLVITIMLCCPAFAMGADAFLSIDHIREQWKTNYCDTEFSKVVTLTTSLIWKDNPTATLVFPAGSQMYFERYQNGNNVKIVSASGRESSDRAVYFFPNEKETIIDRSINDKTATIVPFNKYLKNMAICELADTTLAYVMHYSDPNMDTPYLLHVLDNANTVVSPEIEVVKIDDMNIPCHVVKLVSTIQTRNGTHSTTTDIWLAHENGMLPIKCHVLAVNDANGFVYEETLITVQKIAKSKNIWYPAVSTKYYKMRGGVAVTSSKVEVLDFQPQTVFDPNIFIAKFPKGTLVGDQVKGISYITGMDDISQMQQVRKLQRIDFNSVNGDTGNKK